MARARTTAIGLAIAVVLGAAMFALLAGLSIVTLPFVGDVAPAAPRAAGGAVQAPRPADAAPAARQVVTPDRVQIGAIGVNAPLIPLGLNPDRTLAVPTKAKVAGWYTGGPTPGKVGPAVVVGHIDLDGVAGVFKRLDRLRPGDRVEFTARDAVTATFVVTHSERVPKEAFPTQRVYGNTSGPELRLITCGGVFDNTTRHYKDNVIVYAKPVG